MGTARRPERLDSHACARLAESRSPFPALGFSGNILATTEGPPTKSPGFPRWLIFRGFWRKSLPQSDLFSPSHGGNTGSNPLGVTTARMPVICWRPGLFLWPTCGIGASAPETGVRARPDAANWPGLGNKVPSYATQVRMGRRHSDLLVATSALRSGRRRPP
jgi:hypothetical protein